MQPKKINSVATTNLDIPARGATPDTTATTEATEAPAQPLPNTNN
jgi:hypothetical protein